MFGWVLFRSDSLSKALGYFSRLLWWHPCQGPDVLYSWGELLPNRTLFYGALGLAGSQLVALPRVESFVAWLVGKSKRSPETSAGEGLRFAFALSAFLLAVIRVVHSKCNPFIYFR